LCKLDLNVLTGPIRDISWDFESKRVSNRYMVSCWYGCSRFIFYFFSVRRSSPCRSHFLSAFCAVRFVSLENDPIRVPPVSV
jgi:hypothetical protein